MCGCVWEGLCVAVCGLQTTFSVCVPTTLPALPRPAGQSRAARCSCHPAGPGLLPQPGVVHGSLGSGSVMLSSFDDKTARRLVVKLDNVRGAPAGSQKSASGAPAGLCLLKMYRSGWCRGVWRGAAAHTGPMPDGSCF